MSDEDHDQLIATFLEITGTTSQETAREILRSCQYDLQTAISTILDNQPISESETRPLLEEMEIDDSLVMPSPGNTPNNRGGALWILRQILAVPLTILTWPAGLLYNLVGIIARLLRFRPPSLRPRNPFSGPQTRSDPTSAAERWLRLLEESTGSVRYSRRNETVENGSSAVASSSTLVQRVGRGTRKVVPDCLVMGYSDALAKAKREIKVLMVVLTCEEHDDDREFKQNVLADAELCRVLAHEGILTWGGDVRDRDAYQVAKTLQYFSLPFVGFVALLQPRSGSTTAPARMTVISRLEGSPSTTTSAASIIAHISTVVLPTVAPYHNRMRAQEVTRAAERSLRAEQDRAVERSAQVDFERVLKKRAEEDERRKTVERIARESEDVQRKEKETLELNGLREEWKRWARFTILNDEPVEGDGETIRIGVMLGDGRRANRKFRLSDSIEKVYCYVECSLDLPPSPPIPAPTSIPSKPKKYEHVYEFRLATTFPRTILNIDGLSGNATIENVLGKNSSVNLVVEGLEHRRASMGESSEEDLEEEEEEEEEE